MLDEEAKALQEIAKASGKAIDAVRATGGFLDDIFGESLRQFGGSIADWMRYYRYRNLLSVIDKVKDLHKSREISGKAIPISPSYALPLLDGISIEAEDTIQNLWAGLIANATDPSRAFQIKKVFIEIIRGLEPLDAKILDFLADPTIDEMYSIFTRATLNADVIAAQLSVDVDDIKLSLQTLARYSCVIDAWENTTESIDTGYSGFRVNNPKSNFRLSHLGKLLIDTTKFL